MNVPIGSGIRPSLEALHRLGALQRGILYEVSENYDWAHIAPAIFGTLFERSLDPGRRSLIGTHYTSEEDILLLIEPVLMQPLRRRWDAVREQVLAALEVERAEDPGKEPSEDADPRVRAIADAARELVRLRDAWLNPPGIAEADLKDRTLTKLYNERPQWLANAHRTLDEAVFAAYGWPPDLGKQEILARLLALNHERAAAQPQ